MLWMQQPPPPAPFPNVALPSMVGAGFEPSSQAGDLSFRCLPSDRDVLKVKLLARPVGEVGPDRPPRRYERIRIATIHFGRRYAQRELEPVNAELARLYGYDKVSILCWRDGPEVSITGYGGWRRTVPRTLVFKVLRDGVRVKGWVPAWPVETSEHP